MTREEAIRILKDSKAKISPHDLSFHVVEHEKNEALDMAIKALEQEPCEDAISRQAAIDAICALCNTGETLEENPWRDNPHIDAIIDAFDNLPPVTPQYTDAEIQKMQEVEQAEIQKAYELGKEEQLRTGHWIWEEDWTPSTPAGPAECNYAGWVCSECGEFPDEYADWDNPDEKPTYKHCPNCGIKMAVTQGSEG